MRLEDAALSKKLHSAILLSLAGNLPLVILSIIKWSIIDFVTVFIMPFLELGTFGLFLAALVWELVFFFKGRKSYRLLAAIPLIISLLTFLIESFVPIDAMVFNYDFRSKEQQRMQAVHLVESGKLSGEHLTTGDLLRLPKEYAQVSKDGEVVVVKPRGSTMVFFYTFCGILDSFSGFVYTSDDKKPSSNDFQANFQEIRRIKPHWYWCASTN